MRRDHQPLGKLADRHRLLPAMAPDCQQRLVLLGREAFLLGGRRAEIHETAERVAQIGERLVIGIAQLVSRHSPHSRIPQPSRFGSGLSALTHERAAGQGDLRPSQTGMLIYIALRYICDYLI